MLNCWKGKKGPRVTPEKLLGIDKGKKAEAKRDGRTPREIREELFSIASNPSFQENGGAGGGD